MPNCVRYLAPAVIALGFLGRADGGTILQTATYNGDTYHLVADDAGGRITWADAEAYAVSLGGHLVTIEDATKNEFILSTFSAAALASAPPNGGLLSLWIGLNDAAQEGSFQWSSGAPVGYTNWVPGEPAGNQSDEDYAAMLVGAGFGSPGQWHDVVSDFRFNDVTFGVVEIRSVPEASSIVMLGTSALGLVGLARRRISAARA